MNLQTLKSKETSLVQLLGWLAVLLPLVLVVSITLVQVLSIVNPYNHVAQVRDYQLAFSHGIWPSKEGLKVLWNRRGEIRTDSRMEEIHTIDLRPWKVCLPSDPQVCKVVRFDPAGIEEFLDLESYSISYEHTDRVFGQSAIHRANLNFTEMMTKYAFDGAPHRFLIIEK